MTGTWPRDVAQHGVRYQLLEPLTAGRARFRFAGPFEGREVVWEATLLALGALPASGERQAYLEIGIRGPETTPIEIGLDVAALDEAAILRAIIMVRQYRRLCRGRMAFGQSL
jgi:hypothetical protein